MTAKKLSIVGLLCVFSFCGNVLMAGDDIKNNKQIDPQQRLQWFRDAKFGMFIHWGLYSLPAGEWKGENYAGIGEWIMYSAKIPISEYQQIAKDFNPYKFDAEKVVKLASQTGMKYIVITSKHHDGFAMYHSKVSKYNIVDATPYKKDPIEQLAKACKKYGLKLCFYYSQDQDWNEPEATGNTWDWPEEGKRDLQKYLDNKAIPQVKEILTQYGPIGLIWFDTPRSINLEQSQYLVDLVHQLQPACLVNGRVGNDAGDYKTMGDNEIPRTPIEDAWETPATLNKTWGYKKDDTNFKSPNEVIHKLVNIVSKGGNYLLNVGPTAEGVIPQGSIEVLQSVGDWMEVNSESIYETSATSLGPLPWGMSTTKPGKIYLHIFKWPRDGKLIVPGIKSEVKKASLLAAKDKNLEITKKGDNLIISLPLKAPDRIDSVIVLQVPEKLQIDKTRVLMKNYSNILGSFEAATSGNAELVKCHWSKDLGDHYFDEFITSLNSPEDISRWTFKTIEPGEYRVKVVYSAQKPVGNQNFVLEFGQNKLPFKCEQTVDISEQKTVDIGTISIPAASKYDLSLKSVNEAVSSIHVLSVNLFAK